MISAEDITTQRLRMIAADIEYACAMPPDQRERVIEEFPLGLIEDLEATLNRVRTRRTGGPRRRLRPASERLNVRNYWKSA